MAQSTALRFRSRQQIDPAVVSDNIPSGQNETFRIIPESVSVTDSQILTFHSRIAGDRLELFTDSDSQIIINQHVIFDNAVVTDNTIVNNSIRKIITEYAEGITDAGFITDKDLLRYRVLSDSIVVLDDFDKAITIHPSVTISRTLPDKLVVNDFVFANSIQTNKRVLPNFILVEDFKNKTVTRASGAVVDRTKFIDIIIDDEAIPTITRGQTQSTTYSRTLPADPVEVTDDALPVFLGISLRTLAETMSVQDFTIASYRRKTVVDAPSVTDQSTELRIRQRVVSDSAVANDDIIVSRSSITNTVTVADSIAFFDQALSEYTQFVQVSAEIIIGIEAQ